MGIELNYVVFVAKWHDHYPRAHRQELQTDLFLVAKISEPESSQIFILPSLLTWHSSEVVHDTCQSTAICNSPDPPLSRRFWRFESTCSRIRTKCTKRERQREGGRKGGRWPSWDWDTFYFLCWKSRLIAWGIETGNGRWRWKRRWSWDHQCFWNQARV